MHPITKLAYMHLEQDLFRSSLLLGEYLLNNQIDRHDTLYVLARSLFSLGHYKKLKELAETYPEMLKDQEIRYLFLRMGCTSQDIQSETDVKGLGSAAFRTVRHAASLETGFKPAALEMLYQGLNKGEKLRKKLLIAAFEKDPYLVEPLVFLSEESLCTSDEVRELIEKAAAVEDGAGKRQTAPSKSHISYSVTLAGKSEAVMKPREYRKFLAFLLFGECPEVIVSPWRLHRECKIYAQQSRLDELFRLSVMGLETFSGCPTTYLSIGMYYLLKGDASEARKPLYKAIKKNPRLGAAYLHAGVMHAQKREVERAVTMLSTALSIMDNSVLPGYFLAFEYQQMNNYTKARYFYECVSAKASRILEAKRGKAAASILPNTFSEIWKEDISPEGTSKTNSVLGMCPEDKDSRAGALKQAASVDSQQQRDLFFILNSYIYCLLYNEEYDDALCLIRTYGITNLLKVYALLFIGDLEAAKEALEMSEECANKTGMYYATRGYFRHLLADYESAKTDYEIAAHHGCSGAIDELLSLVSVNITGEETNRAFDYANSLFDMLEYNQRNIQLSKTLE